MYGLRKINQNGMHHGFQWPLTVGSAVSALDWNPSPKCGEGLHVLPNAQGSYSLLDGHFWAVVEFDESELVMIGSGVGKVPSCTIVHISDNTDGLLDFFKDVQFSSESAFGWAHHIGDREHMKQFVTEPLWAYYWARNIGDREHMMQFVTESGWAYLWADDIGDSEHMKQFVTESEWAYEWARNIGDREHMRQFVTHPTWAYEWAVNIGDRKHMKQFFNK
jgi:hypothetical protein